MNIVVEQTFTMTYPPFGRLGAHLEHFSTHSLILLQRSFAPLEIFRIFARPLQNFLSFSLFPYTPQRSFFKRNLLYFQFRRFFEPLKISSENFGKFAPSCYLDDKTKLLDQENKGEGVTAITATIQLIH